MLMGGSPHRPADLDGRGYRGKAHIRPARQPGQRSQTKTGLAHLRHDNPAQREIHPLAGAVATTPVAVAGAEPSGPWLQRTSLPGADDKHPRAGHHGVVKPL